MKLVLWDRHGVGLDYRSSATAGPVSRWVGERPVTASRHAKQANAARYAQMENKLKTLHAQCDWCEIRMSFWSLDLSLFGSTIH